MTIFLNLLKKYLDKEIKALPSTHKRVKGKDVPVNKQIIDYLKSTSAEELQKKLERHMSPLLQVGLDVQLVAFDGEKSIDCDDTSVMISKLQAKLDVNTSTHVGMIENDTRYAKNKLRGMQATFPVSFKGLKLVILALAICSLYINCSSNVNMC